MFDLVLNKTKSCSLFSFLRMEGSGFYGGRGTGSEGIGGESFIAWDLLVRFCFCGHFVHADCAKYESVVNTNKICDCGCPLDLYRAVDPAESLEIPKETFFILRGTFPPGTKGYILREKLIRSLSQPMDEVFVMAYNWNTLPCTSWPSFNTGFGYSI